MNIIQEKRRVLGAESRVNRQIAEWLNDSVHLVFSQPAESLHLAECARQAAETLLDCPQRAEIFHACGKAHLILGNADQAMEDFRAGLAAAQLANQPIVEARCFHDMATLLWQQAKHAECLEALHRALLLWNETGDSGGHAKTLNSLGALYGALGSYEEAAVYFTQCLETAQRNGEWRAELAALSNIANLKTESELWDEAIRFTEMAIEKARAHDDRLSLCSIMTNHVHCLCKQEYFETAEAMARAALMLSQELGNRYLEMLSLAALAKSISHKENEAAEALYLQAKEISQKDDFQLFLTDIYIMLGKHSKAWGKPEAALQHFESGLAHARLLNLRKHESDFLLLLSETHTLLGDYLRALDFHCAYHTAETALKKESAQNLIAAKMARLELDRALKESEIARLRNVELAEANWRNGQLIETLKEQADQFERLAMVDALTGLYNRRYLNDTLPREVERARRSAQPLCLAVADLDDFKQINDKLSHAVGDKVLKKVADVITELVRTPDTVARYGGEEFVVLFPETRCCDAVAICERLRVGVESVDWQQIHPDLSVRISIGVADELNADAQSLLAAADKRMYQAKQSGKNRVV